jgi:hypothetical protein
MPELASALKENHAFVLLLQKYVHEKPDELNNILRYGDGTYNKRKDAVIDGAADIVLENELNDKFSATERLAINAAVTNALKNNPYK